MIIEGVKVWGESGVEWDVGMNENQKTSLFLELRISTSFH